jgi:hypothetical protein
MSQGHQVGHQSLETGLVQQEQQHQGDHVAVAGGFQQAKYLGA